MSLESILKRIMDDARAEADKIILEGRKRAEAIEEAARKEASELADALLNEAEKEARLEASRLVTQARLEKKIRILQEKKKLIDEVLESAMPAESRKTEMLKKKVIFKDGVKEEPVDMAHLAEEIRPGLEKNILEALKT